MNLEMPFKRSNEFLKIGQKRGGGDIFGLINSKIFGLVLTIEIFATCSFYRSLCGDFNEVFVTCFWNSWQICIDRNEQTFIYLFGRGESLQLRKSSAVFEFFLSQRINAASSCRWSGKSYSNCALLSLSYDTYVKKLQCIEPDEMRYLNYTGA
jgi:hypothetical protein